MKQSVFSIFLCVILVACSSMHRAGKLSSSEIIGYASNGYIMDKNKEIIGYYRNGYTFDTNNRVTGTYRNGYVFNTNDSIIAFYSNGYILNYLTTNPSINDSIKPMMFKVDNIGMRPINLPMMPQYENNDSVNGNKFFMYYAKPFKTGEITNGKFLPLVLLGSMWYDKSIGFHRFCGEKEIDPDMSSKILKYIPHYYVIGIEVNPMKML